MRAAEECRGGTGQAAIKMKKSWSPCMAGSSDRPFTHPPTPAHSAPKQHLHPETVGVVQRQPAPPGGRAAAVGLDTLCYPRSQPLTPPPLIYPPTPPTHPTHTHLVFSNMRITMCVM